mmetsp:Transcript_64787/g.173853  ORF Transcript_64787/g.173853 Transcript_64787/m.173853 type:complete len:206 (+) Transcript_64787:626-1243(+)
MESLCEGARPDLHCLVHPSLLFADRGQVRNVRQCRGYPRKYCTGVRYELDAALGGQHWLGRNCTGLLPRFSDGHGCCCRCLVDRRGRSICCDGFRQLPGRCPAVRADLHYLVRYPARPFGKEVRNVALFSLPLQPGPRPQPRFGASGLRGLHRQPNLRMMLYEFSPLPSFLPSSLAGRQLVDPWVDRGGSLHPTLLSAINQRFLY